MWILTCTQGTLKYSPMHFQQDLTTLTMEKTISVCFSNPFAFPDEKLHSLESNLQVEIIDLQCSAILRGDFSELGVSPSPSAVCHYCNLLPAAEYGHLHMFVQHLICRFGSTYRCEQSFSCMKLIKIRSRSRLADAHLHDLISLATTQLHPDIEKLASALETRLK